MQQHEKQVKRICRIANLNTMSTPLGLIFDRVLLELVSAGHSGLHELHFRLQLVVSYYCKQFNLVPVQLECNSHCCHIFSHAKQIKM